MWPGTHRGSAVPTCHGLQVTAPPNSHRRPWESRAGTRAAVRSGLVAERIKQEGEGGSLSPAMRAGAQSGPQTKRDAPGGQRLRARQSM